jgi:hypothetical protein
VKGVSEIDMGKKYSRVRAHIRVHCSCDNGDVEEDIKETRPEKTTEIKVLKVKEGDIKVGW